MTRTDLPAGDEDVAAPPAAAPSSTAAELRRLRRGLRRRSVRMRRRSFVLSRRLVVRAVRAWRSSLQVRIAAITMVVAGTVVVIVSLVLFSQIRDQLLSVKRQAAIDQAQAGVLYARSQAAGIATGDAASVRSALSRTVTQLVNRGGAAGTFEVVMLYRTGKVERTAPSPSPVLDALPSDLRAAVDSGGQAWRYALVPDSNQVPQPTLLIGAAVPTTTSGQQIELYYAFSMAQEGESLSLIRSTVIISGVALTLFVVGIGVLVTRLVVDPVRRAAGIAQRLAEGELEERMVVRGEDDLARLATSFNAMADSLQRQITQLEALSQLQQRFTSDVSHELRTPLTTVQMAADVLHEARGEFAPHVARSAELLRAELDRFEGLLTDLLEISRYDAGAAVLDSEPVDLGALVARVAAGMWALAERHESELIVNRPETEDVIAEVDARRVERILRNLVGNAIEHGAGKPVEITLAANRTAAAVTVRDFGVGLSSADAQHVFDRFWRADPSRVRTVGGSGLGLSISLEDARLHGGWLQVWGQPGAGAQFRLTLPLTAGGDLTSSPLPLRPAVVRRPGTPS